MYGVAELAMQLQANDIDKFYVSFAAGKYRRLNYDRLKLVGVQGELNTIQCERLNIDDLVAEGSKGSSLEREQTVCTWRIEPPFWNFHSQDAAFRPFGYATPAATWCDLRSKLF